MSAFSNKNQVSTPTDGNVLTIKTVQIAPFRTLMTALKDPTVDGLNRAFSMLDSTGIDTKGLRNQFAQVTDDKQRLSMIQSYVSSHPEGIAAMKFVAPEPMEVTRADGSKIFMDKNPNSPTFNTEIMTGQAAGMTPFQTGTLGVSKGNLAVNQGNLAVNQGRLGVERAGLGIRAIQADPYNISGVQAAFPIPGAAVAGTPSSTEKQPSGAPVVQNASAAMKAGLTGEDLLTHLPSPLASQIRAIGEGREPSPASRSLTSPAGRQLMDLVNAAYPTYDAKQYATMGTAEKAFTSGKKGDTTRSLNVAVDHLGTLQQVSDALQNGDTRLFNQAGNFIALQTGNPAPTDFNAVKRIVADEITKAVIGSAGALGDRKAVDETISSANSPAQLKSVIDRYKQLMGGQLNGIEQQYTASTGKKDFRNRFLTPTTQAALGSGAAAPAASGVDTSNKWLK